MTSHNDKARSRCGSLFLHTARRRGLYLGIAEIAKLESRIARLQPCFERPDQHRYELTLRIQRKRIPVIYDTSLRCLVSVSGGTR